MADKCIDCHGEPDPDEILECSMCGHPVCVGCATVYDDFPYCMKCNIKSQTSGENGAEKK